MGEKVRVIFDKENKNAVDDAVKAFTSGHGENMSISDSRALQLG